MTRKSQLGRKMLEMMMVLGLMGVLSVTGIYMYKGAMNDVRADGIVKDVLARASQKKGNLELGRSGVGKKMVYTPEYKKKDGSETTKGRYGYSFEIDSANSNYETIIIQTKEKEISTGVCKSLKSKFKTYKKGTFSRVLVVGGESNGANILIDDCPNKIPSLKFYVSYSISQELT